MLTVVGLLWLCWWWIRGYKRASFPSASGIPEGIVVFTAALAAGNAPSALALISSGLVFRSLYGTQRSVLAALLPYLGAFCGAVALSILLTDSS